MEWDTAAGHAILNAAGGSVRTLDRKVLKYGKKGFKNPSFIAKELIKFNGLTRRFSNNFFIPKNFVTIDHGTDWPTFNFHTMKGCPTTFA
jgi:hypothetical protein